MLGISHLLKQFCDSVVVQGKLVVGHNMVLDVMHMLNQFCYPLPQVCLKVPGWDHNSFQAMALQGKIKIEGHLTVKPPLSFQFYHIRQWTFSHYD